MSIQKQAIINTLGNTIYLIALWLITVITTNVLGYLEVGTLTLAMAVANVIATVQMYGVRGFQSSDITGQFSKYDYLYARIFTVIIGWVIGVIVCIVLDYTQKVSFSVLLFIALKTSESLSDALYGNDQRAGHLECAGFSMTGRGIVLIVFFGSTVVVAKNLNVALLVSGCALLMHSLLIDLPVHNKITSKMTSKSQRGFIGIVKKCFPLFFATLMPAIITAFPRVALEHFYGAEELGYYGNISAPALLLTTALPTALTALLPGYGQEAENKDYLKMKKTWRQSILVTVGVTGICLFGVVIAGKQVLTLVYSHKVIPYVHYLYYILLAMMLFAITMCNNTVLVALRRNWGILFTTSIALIVCLAISLPLVRGQGISGAIKALAIPYAIQAFIQIIWIIQLLGNGDKYEATTP